MVVGAAPLLYWQAVGVLEHGDSVEYLLSGTVVVWGMIALTVAATASAALAWRTRNKLRRATHYFPKYQAEIKWQMYTTATAALLMLLGVLSGYYWLGGLSEQSFNIAAASEEVVVEPSPTPTIIATAAPTRTPVPTRRAVPTREPIPTRKPVLRLPPEYSQVQSEQPLNADVALSNMQFSAEVSADYDPISPTLRFDASTNIIYATFDYENMENGLAWSWLWRRNGEVVEGANELWQYGDEGPGYLFLSPPDGIDPGEYSAEIWINETLFLRQNIAVGIDIPTPTNEPIVSAGRNLISEVSNVDNLLTNVELTSTPDVPDTVVTVREPLIINGRFDDTELPRRYKAAAAEPISETVSINILRFSADIHLPTCPQTDACPNQTAFALSAAFHPLNVPKDAILTYIWRYNDTILTGQSEPWVDETASIQYLNIVPENGLLSGEYSLEIWANNVQFSLASLDVTSENIAKIE